MWLSVVFFIIYSASVINAFWRFVEWQEAKKLLEEVRWWNERVQEQKKLYNDLESINQELWAEYLNAVAKHNEMVRVFNGTQHREEWKQ